MTVDANSNAPIHQRRCGTTRRGWNVSGMSIPSDLRRGLVLAKPRSSATCKLDQFVRRERGKDELDCTVAASDAEDVAALHRAGRPEVARHGNSNLRHRHRFEVAR